MVHIRIPYSKKNVKQRSPDPGQCVIPRLDKPGKLLKPSVFIAKLYDPPAQVLRDILILKNTGDVFLQKLIEQNLIKILSKHQSVLPKCLK